MVSEVDFKKIFSHSGYSYLSAFLSQIYQKHQKVVGMVVQFSPILSVDPVKQDDGHDFLQALSYFQLPLMRQTNKRMDMISLNIQETLKGNMKIK